MNIYLGLSCMGAIPVIVSVIFAFLEKNQKILKINYHVRQLIVGVIFGGLAILGTEFGIDIGGAAANARDAAPLCAGLLFGSPAGIIAGFIGGLERWLCVLWGGGTYTRIACSVSTFIAGITGAVVRKLILSDRRPSWFYGLMTGLVAEVFHMLMIFITNMSDIRTAFHFVDLCTFPMVIVNSLSVMVASVLVGLIDRSAQIDNDRSTLSTQFQSALIRVVFIAFLVTSGFTFIIQNSISTNDTESTLRLNMEDVRRDLSDTLAKINHSDNQENYLFGLTSNRHIGNEGNILILNSNYIVLSRVRESHYSESRYTPLISVLETGNANSVFEVKLEDTDYFGMFSECYSYYIVSLYPVSEAHFARNLSLYMTLFMEILVFAALFVLIYILIQKRVVDNITHVNVSLLKITAGNLNEVVSVRSSSEFSSLSDGINSTVDALKNYIDEAAAKYDQELEVARTIQASALPILQSGFANREEFDLYAFMTPAKEVGGDFYDFFYIDNDTNRLAFLIADVSGKGIPGAMFMMTTKPLIKSLAESGTPIDEVYNESNNTLCTNNEGGMFVTSWMGSLNIAEGLLSYVNAGHNPPLLKHKDGAFEYFKAPAGFVLAGIEDYVYKKNETRLQPGDILFLYTDGVTEATDANNELYGEIRLQNCLNSLGDISSEEICKRVKADLDSFVGEAPQFDDITMVCFKYRP